MKDFLFSPEQARTPVGVLSGGERGRLMLACALAQPANLLVLDEPTNDLDLETLDLLQEMLADYPGTVLLVSHDRDFLDRVVDLACWWPRAAGAGSNMPAATATCWSSAARLEATAAVDRRRAAAAGATPPRRPAAQPQALLQGPARAGDAAGADRGAAKPRSPRCARRWPTPTCTAATPPRFAPRHAPRWREAEPALAAAEERWLELEMLREEIEA